MLKLISIHKPYNHHTNAPQGVIHKKNTNSFDFDIAQKNTQIRLTRSKNKKTIQRLQRRLDNLKILKEFINSDKKNTSLVKVVGWGECTTGEKPNSGISQYDTFFIKKNGKLQAYQLDSALEVQNWGTSFLQSKKNTLNSHVLTYDVGFDSRKINTSFKYDGNNYIKEKSNFAKIKPQFNPNIGTNLKNKKKHTHIVHPQHSLTTLGSKQTTEFSISSIKHEEHTHYSLIASRSKQSLEDTQLKNEDEGCPCCTAGLDFDEFAAAINEISSSSSGASESEIYSLSDYESASHWGVSLGIAAPFSIIGLTASLRNIEGCWNNLKKLKTIITTIEEELQTAKEKKDKALILQLTAFKNTLYYSRFDTKFNLMVPGIINGAASSLVLSTIVWSNPFALPVLATYAFGQCYRNSYDLYRVWNHKVFHDPQVSTCTQSGISKINSIAVSKRKFYSSNVLGFSCFAVGAGLTFVSIPALALGVGVATLPVGLALLSFGASSTGIINNIWPRKFKPRNGNLGISRKELTKETMLHEIGKRKKMKSILKTSKRNNLTSSSLKKFSIQVLSALPFGEKKAQTLKHRYNLKLINRNQETLKNARSAILTELLRSQDDSINVNPTLESQWEACKTLDIASGVINTLLTTFNTTTITTASCSPNCTHTHAPIQHMPPAFSGFCAPCDEETSPLLCQPAKVSHLTTRSTLLKISDQSSCCNGSDTIDDYTLSLKQSGYFNIIGKKVRLKPFLRLTSKQKEQLELAIDFYLHVELIKKLRYEQYGLNDFYWQYQKEYSTLP